MSGSGCQLKKSQAFPSAVSRQPSAVAALCVRLMAKCMPAQALAPMWQALKHGQSWMGLVKNRCKNSDHFSGISERLSFTGKCISNAGVSLLGMRPVQTLKNLDQATRNEINAYVCAGSVTT
ncbi:hypothetical protein ACOYXF_00730 [Pseudomonas sp. Tul1A2]